MIAISQIFRWRYRLNGLVLRRQLKEGITNHTLTPWGSSLIVSHPPFLLRWGCFRVTAEIELPVPACLGRCNLWGGRSGSFWDRSRES